VASEPSYGGFWGVSRDMERAAAWQILVHLVHELLSGAVSKTCLPGGLPPPVLVLPLINIAPALPASELEGASPCAPVAKEPPPGALDNHSRRPGARPNEEFWGR